MKDSLRRPILFAVIVITGSVLILFDIPLIIMLPVVLIVGFAILIILGAITGAEIKNALKSLKPANIKKIGIIKRLDEMKFFEKPALPKDKTPPASKDKIPQAKAPAQQPVKELEKKKGIGLHLSSFVSSIKSLGTLLRESSKREKKVEDINKQLDKTISEKVEKSSALASAGNVAAVSGGAGASAAGPAHDQDPFLSLSEDEFDAGLLDSLDELDSPASLPDISSGTPAPMTGSLDISEPDIPLPSLDIDGEAGNILKDSAQGLEEFSGLDGSDTIDDDFGSLDDLNLDDVDLEDESGEKPASPAPASKPAPAVNAAAPAQGKDVVKTAWIKSDAPKDAALGEDLVSTQSDMAAFSEGASGSDADLLSSLASDVKAVKKDKDLSLLRELKDFKAPAVEIENELSEMYVRMNAIPKSGEKKPLRQKE